MIQKSVAHRIWLTCEHIEETIAKSSYYKKWDKLIYLWVSYVTHFASKAYYPVQGYFAKS